MGELIHELQSLSIREYGFVRTPDRLRGAPGAFENNAS